MFILGLTGSIGMGKTTAARCFARLGVPVHDSDAAVHTAMERNGPAIQPVAAIFPDAVRDGVIDRQRLGQTVFADSDALEALENILHPLVRRSEDKFLGFHARLKTPAVVLDVPLLYETGGQTRCDAVAVVSAPFREQRRRVLSRPGMTEDKFESILNHQISDNIKETRQIL